MRETIRGYADAVFETAAVEDRLPVVAAELAALAELVRSSEDLRGVLTDPGVPAHRRRAALVELLTPRLSADVVGLAAHAVESDRAPETSANLAGLASAAAAAAAGQPEPAGVLGRMAARERLDGYASAVLGALEAGAPGSLAAVEEEVFRFSRIVAGSEELRVALTDRDVPAERRAAVVSELVAGRVTPATARVLTYAVRTGRARDLAETLNWLVERVSEESNRRVAEVRAAVELDAEQRRRLGDALARITGRPVQLRVAVAPELLGGFVAAIGDTLVDGSVRHRLDQLKERISLPEVEIVPERGHTNIREPQ